MSHKQTVKSPEVRAGVLPKEIYLETFFDSDERLADCLPKVLYLMKGKPMGSQMIITFINLSLRFFFDQVSRCIAAKANVAQFHCAQHCLQSDRKSFHRLRQQSPNAQSPEPKKELSDETTSTELRVRLGQLSPRQVKINLSIGQR